MGSLSPRLQLRVAQKQILTPGLVQMVAVLQLNRLELKEMISQEISQNPVLEEGTNESGEELSPEELHALLEAERVEEPADQSILEAVKSAAELSEGVVPVVEADGPSTPLTLETEQPAAVEQKPETDPFDEIDFGSFFDDYLDPGYKSPASESVDKPSFETFLSAPFTLADHLRSQLSLVVVNESARDAAELIIGNLDENGYLTASVEEIATAAECAPEEVAAALELVQTLDPAGVGARDVRECLLLQLESRGGRNGVAWSIVADHMKLLELRHYRELARLLNRPQEHIETAVEVIHHLDPRPGLCYSGPGARQVEPDVYIYKDGEEFVIQLDDEDLPQLRLNPQYRRMLDRRKEPDKDVRNYIKERYSSALQLMKNIEQRKQTILRVCHAIVDRQPEFLESGIDSLKPMMIKEIAEEIGVHPSTVSRAVANKYAHTPQGVFELRYFFSEAVQGPSGSAMPLLLLKRKVKKMIADEDPAHPLTDEHIMERLRKEGVRVTRRTVAKYREDMKIPSTHQRRVRS